jgi:hypothetical protein
LWFEERGSGAFHLARIVAGKGRCVTRCGTSGTGGPPVIFLEAKNFDHGFHGWARMGGKSAGSLSHPCTFVKSVVQPLSAP